MYFTEIAETVKIELYADGVQLLKRACEIASRSESDLEFSILAGAFAAAEQVIAAHAAGFAPKEEQRAA